MTVVTVIFGTIRCSMKNGISYSFFIHKAHKTIRCIK